MSNSTGRPKEEGGHERINISLDKPTRDFLQQVPNKSKFIEYAIHSWTKPHRIRFREREETVSHNQYKFKDAGVFDWTPNDSEDNAILAVYCYFRYRCGGKGLGFRITIDGETIISNNGWLTSIDYTSSPTYTDCSCGSDEKAKIFPNQPCYTIKFQFKPRSSFDEAYVKDINIYIDVVDKMPALEP